MSLKNHELFTKSLGWLVLALGLGCLAVDSARAAASPLVVNGSFESDYTGWVTSGNQFIASMFPYTASDGVKLVSFNGNSTSDLPPNGVLSQTFQATPGTTYTLTFDMGVIGSVNAEQKLQVTVDGAGNLLTQIASKTKVTGGTAQWTAKSYTFVANSPQTTLTFRDVSTITTGIDALLDNVRVSVDSSLPPVTLHGLNLAWNAVSGTNVTGYKVYVGTQSEQYTATYATGGGTTFPLTGLEFGRTYYLAVSAVGDTGVESSLSVELIVTIAPPPLPTGSQLRSTASGVLALEWTLPTSAIGSSPEFIVQASPDLVNWTQVATVLATDAVGGDKQSQRFSWSVPRTAGQMFYRLTAENWLGSSTAP